MFLVANVGLNNGVVCIPFSSVYLPDRNRKLVIQPASQVSPGLDPLNLHDTCRRNLGGFGCRHHIPPVMYNRMLCRLSIASSLQLSCYSTVIHTSGVGNFSSNKADALRIPYVSNECLIRSQQKQDRFVVRHTSTHCAPLAISRARCYATLSTNSHILGRLLDKGNHE